MNRRNRISAIFCFLLGLSVLIKGMRLGLKLDQEMGPGFFPFIAGGILTFLSLLLLIQSLMDHGISGKKELFWVNPSGWKRVFLTLFATAAYPLMINPLGFILSTLFLLFFFFKVIARMKWWSVGVGGTVTTICAYLIFEIWLKANLPQGLLSF
jgi:hypothetical protein